MGGKRLLKDRVERLFPQPRREAAGKNCAAEVEGELPCFETTLSRMQSGAFRQQGLFLGSGVAEAGCKTVIGPRGRQSGMFGRQRGAERVLALCAAFTPAAAWTPCWKERLNASAAKNDCLRLSA